MKNITTPLKGLLFFACLYIGTSNAEAQITCSRTELNGTFTIQSNEDYRNAKDSIERVAYTLSTFYQTYPNFKYVHQQDDAGRVSGVLVMGINDTEVATTAARHIMTLELLGEAINTMDRAFLPVATASVKERPLTEKEALSYKPKQPQPKVPTATTPALASSSKVEM